MAALSGIAAELAGDHERAALAPARGDPARGAARGSALADLGGPHGDYGGRVSETACPTRPARSRSRESGRCSASCRWRCGQQANALTGQGRFKLAYAAAEEGIRLASDFGHQLGRELEPDQPGALLDALRGDEAAARDHADEAMELAAISGGTTLIVGFAEWALGLLELTLGRPSEATDRLLLVTAVERARVESALIGAVVDPRPDRSGGTLRAARRDGDRFDRYTGWVQHSPSPARLSVLARCRALVGEGDEREQFETALAPDATLSPFVRARTELLYGEWLRRERKRREARRHLRRAADLFRQVGAPPWEERAEAELRATGETARRRDPSTLDQLTPQELQIAGLVAAGMTNRQIAAQLYLSPRTIDYHLRKVFSKLGVASRTELVRMGVPEQEPSDTAAVVG